MTLPADSGAKAAVRSATDRPVAALPLVWLNQTATRFTDTRGHLDVLYEHGDVVLKRSFSRAGVFRGMHWQRPPHAQSKLIRVVSGRILDFVVDPQSEPRQLFHRELGPDDGWVLVAAELAHGFYAIQDTEFEYLCHGAYAESAEHSYSILHHLAEHHGIHGATVSAKDAAAAPLAVTAAPQHR
ncbi:MAG: dTDP-4-dehydrorhamnose 3,5-epimerase family protein [Rhodoferax sp.]|nr:dTDP-4-dehydrorhamnose 3,5-epimerase family protein [Rhodoferax sp.]MCB2044330.1 dTDP-4-dehydrorhamnose 3,5-epimerase family protein [Rhodoferax sp.]MCP5263828.1 dTDP-4-dehydrorhamnose 3,5-epimerase family protein [Rhodoferax sp.]MCW5641920.1 dTDP-4-dehydrorhamnose 3,5-epimerase family protein [Rhodoferax sp.]